MDFDHIWTKLASKSACCYLQAMIHRVHSHKLTLIAFLMASIMSQLAFVFESRQSVDDIHRNIHENVLLAFINTMLCMCNLTDF